MKLKDHWIEIVTVSWTALALGVALTHAQDAAIITTSQSKAEYQPGTYEDELPTPKPVGVNMLRSVLDRADFLDPNTKVEWGVFYSMDGGATYKLWKLTGTNGGDLTRFGIFTSSWTHPAPPEGALMINKFIVTGGPVKAGTVLQMWEAR
jgi:hypothetical protein